MPCAHYIRFTEDDNVRLHRAARKRGLTIQTFARSAVMRALVEFESGRMDDALHESSAAGAPAAAEPQGLGIRARLEAEAKRTAEPDDLPPPPVAAAPVVVNVGATHGGGAIVTGSDVVALARMCVDSQDRRRALESACRILAQGRTREEALAAADDLNAAIKRLDTQPQSVLEKVRARRDMRKR